MMNDSAINDSLSPSKNKSRSQRDMSPSLGSAPIEIYYNDPANPANHNLELLVAASPMRSPTIGKGNQPYLHDKAKKAAVQLERHAKLKVQGKQAATVEAPESWREIVNFAGKPRYDLHLRKEFYKPCKDGDLIQLKSMAVKHGPNGMTIKQSGEGQSPEGADNVDKPMGIPPKDEKDETSSWGDSTIENILDLRTMSLRASLTVAVFRPYSAMNDDLPKTPQDLCRQLGLDPKIALDLDSHPSNSNNNSMSPLLLSTSRPKTSEKSRVTHPHGSGTVFAYVEGAGAAITGVIGMKSATSSRPGTSSKLSDPTDLSLDLLDSAAQNESRAPSRGIEVRPKSEKPLSGIHARDPDPTSAFTDLSGVDPLWDPANFRKPVGSASGSRSGSRNEPRAESGRSPGHSGGRSGRLGSPPMASAPSSKPTSASSGFRAAGFFESPTHGTAVSAGDNAPLEINTRVREGSALPGALKMCRPGVVGGPPADPFVQSPTKGKQHSGQQSGQHSGKKKLGLSTLHPMGLRPIDDDASLTASDESAAGSDGEDSQESTGWAPPLGSSAKRSGKSPRGAGHRQKGNIPLREGIQSGAMGDGVTHEPEFYNHGKGSLGSLAVQGVMHPGSPSRRLNAGRSNSSFSYDGPGPASGPSTVGVQDGEESGDGGSGRGSGRLGPELTGRTSELLVSSLLSRFVEPAPSPVVTFGLYTRQAAEDAAKLTPVTSTVGSKPTPPAQDTSIASIDRRPRVVCANCANRGSLWCKRCETSYCYDCWGMVDHHNPTDAFAMLAKATFSQTGSLESSEHSSKHPSRPNSSRRTIDPDEGVLRKKEDRRYLVHHSRGPKRDPNLVRASSPLPPKNFTALAVLEIHPADDVDDFGDASDPGHVTSLGHPDMLEFRSDIRDSIMSDNEEEDDVYSEGTSHRSSTMPLQRSTFHGTGTGTHGHGATGGLKGAKVEASAERRVKLKNTSLYDVKYQDYPQAGYYMDGSGKLNNLVHLDPHSISPLEAYLVSGGSGSRESRSRNSWKLRSKVFLNRQSASIHEKKMKDAKRRRRHPKSPAAALEPYIQDVREYDTLNAPSPMNDVLAPPSTTSAQGRRKEGRGGARSCGVTSSVERHFFESIAEGIDSARATSRGGARSESRGTERSALSTAGAGADGTEVGGVEGGGGGGGVDGLEGSATPIGSAGSGSRATTATGASAGAGTETGSRIGTATSAGADASASGNASAGPSTRVGTGIGTGAGFGADTGTDTGPRTGTGAGGGARGFSATDDRPGPWILENSKSDEKVFQVVQVTVHTPSSTREGRSGSSANAGTGGSSNTAGAGAGAGAGAEGRRGSNRREDRRSNPSVTSPSTKGDAPTDGRGQVHPLTHPHPLMKDDDSTAANSLKTDKESPPEGEDTAHALSRPMSARKAAARRPVPVNRPLSLSLAPSSATTKMVTAVIEGGQGNEEGRNVVVYHGVGVFTRNNKKG